MKALPSCILLVFLLNLSTGGWLGAATLFSGQVITSEGEALIGATLFVEETGVLTTTDFYGYFQLDVEGAETITMGGVYCFGRNFFSWCGQEYGLIVLEAQGPVCYDDAGRKSCGVKRRKRRTRKLADQYYPGIRARYDQRQGSVLGQGDLGGLGAAPVAALVVGLVQPMVYDPAGKRNLVGVFTGPKRTAEGDTRPGWRTRGGSPRSGADDPAAQRPKGAVAGAHDELWNDSLRYVTISGTVVDSISREPLIGVSVLSRYCCGSSVSNIDGIFHRVIGADCKDVSFHQKGYDPKFMKTADFTGPLIVELVPCRKFLGRCMGTKRPMRRARRADRVARRGLSEGN